MSEGGLQRFQEFVEEVRRQSSIVDIVGADAKLEKTGNDFKCCSPLRQEKTPSLWLYPSSDSWYDFGTSEGGDAFSYVQKRDGVDFKGAVEVLAARLGLVPYWKASGDVDEYMREVQSFFARRRVNDILTEAAGYYHRNLPSRIRATQYREHYGFTDQTIDDLKLGWADGHLFEYLTDLCGHSKEDCLRTGLFLELGREKIVKDFFEDRLVFPYWSRGQAVYFIARRVEGITSDDDHEKAKYKKLLVHNEKHPYVSPTVSNEWFYNEDAISDARRSGLLAITEGVTDCISGRQAGIAIVSPVTTAFRDKDIPKLIKLTEKIDRIVLCNDADVLPDGRRPGDQGALKTSTALFRAGRDVRIAALPRPAGATKIDLNEFVRDRGADALKPILDAAAKYPLFLIQQIETTLDGTDLEKRLDPVAEVIAACNSIARDGYIANIAKRFKVPKATVRQLVAKFAPPEPEPTPEEVKEKGKADDRIRGRITEDLSFYYVTTGTGDEVISSFTLQPRQRIAYEHGELIACDIVTPRGTIKNHVFPKNAWVSKRDFLRSFPSPDMQWKGNDDNVQDVLRLVAAQDVPRREGTSNLGYHETKAGPRWVWPGGVIGPEGHMPDPDVVYVPTGASLPQRVSYDQIEPEQARELATTILPALLELNTPEVILPILGWFFACPFKPRINRILGHFPILVVWGTQGSGKTSIVREIFWPLSGVSGRTDPYSATETEFALIKQFSSTDSVPLPLDEYKPRDMGKIKDDRIRRMLRRVYGGETEERGRADQTVATYHLSAPIVLMGETRPEGDPALIERMISVSPDKNSLMKNPSYQATFQKIARLPIAKLAGPLVQFSLSRDVAKDLDAARVICDQVLARVSRSSKVPPRCYDNLLTMTFGLMMFEQFAASYDIAIPDLNIVPAFASQVLALLEGDGGAVKDAFDSFLEQLSVYAIGGALTDGKHYAMINGMLNLHLPGCYQVYLEQRRKTGQEDDTNGMRALKKVANEKFDRQGYITNTDARAQLGEHNVRCIVIDMSKIPDGLDVERFPATKEREWGGGRYGGSTRWGGKGGTGSDETAN